MFNRRHLTLGALATLTAVSTSGRIVQAQTAQPLAAEPLAGKLTLTGSSTIAPLISEIGNAFEAANPKVRVDVQSGGSSRGIADARSGLANTVTRDHRAEQVFFVLIKGT